MVATLETTRAHLGSRVGLHPEVDALPRERLERLPLRRLQACLRNAWDHVAWPPMRATTSSRWSASPPRCT